MSLAKAIKFLSFSNPDASCEKEQRVSQAVLAVLINDHVEQISCVPDIVNPHSVSTPSSGTEQRLILDPRYVNSFIL